MLSSLSMTLGPQENHLTFRGWTIQDEQFLPFYFEHLSIECWKIIGALRRLDLGEHLIYIRGSIVEEMVPHPQADLDLVIIGESNPISLIEEALFFCHRPDSKSKTKPSGSSFLALLDHPRLILHRVAVGPK